MCKHIVMVCYLVQALWQGDIFPHHMHIPPHIYEDNTLLFLEMARAHASGVLFNFTGRKLHHNTRGV